MHTHFVRVLQLPTYLPYLPTGFSLSWIYFLASIAMDDVARSIR